MNVSLATEWPDDDAFVDLLDTVKDGQVTIPTDWLKVFEAGALSAGALKDLDVAARPSIIGTWFRAGDLGFIFAPRGLGKTFFAMYLAKAAASGTGAGPWAVDRKWNVVYVDGEMPLDGTQARDHQLGANDLSSLVYMHHEHVFAKTDKVLNFTDGATQVAFLQYCIDNAVEVVVLDNLSCLFRGVKENDADEWEKVLPWLLDFRRNQIAVVIVAHAGRNREMRGTSRREDAAFWMIRLEETRGDEPALGARFISRFTKSRNATEAETQPLEWEFTTHGNVTDVTFKTVSNLDAFVQHVRDGLTSATDIAEEMGLSKGTISKLAKKAETARKITINGRQYVPVS